MGGRLFGARLGDLGEFCDVIRALMWLLSALFSAGCGGNRSIVMMAQRIEAQDSLEAGR